jgi:hypothetical protein
MKKICLSVLLSIVSFLGYSQNVLSLFGKANTFFDLFEAGKFTEAQQYFSEEARAKVSADQLKMFWTAMHQQLGATKSLDASASKNQGEYFLVTVNGIFENGTQDFSLTFDKKEQLIGLFLKPKQAAYHAASYADSTQYTETFTSIKTGSKQLAAMLTIPKNAKNFPIVVLVHGSGPNDMDETIGPNKPFKDIAAGLAVNGIASLRYVKRTVVYPKDFSGAFTVKEEVIDDALQAIALAKAMPDVDVNSVYLLGHSLGGMLAPRIASATPDLRGIILAAAPARSLSDIIIEQNKYMVAYSKDTTKATQQQLAEAITEIEKTKLSKLKKIKPDSLMMGLPASYWVGLNNYNQLDVAKKLKNQRILVLQGGFDFQVTETDFHLWEQALADKAKSSFKFYPSLNHLFSLQFEKGTVAQYQKPANVDQKVIEDIAAWIKLPE